MARGSAGDPVALICSVEFIEVVIHLALAETSLCA